MSGDSRWITWFCGIRGNEMFCEVDVEFIRDRFNMQDLPTLVPLFDIAVDILLNQDAFDEDEARAAIAEQSAELLYGLIHARYILTNRGISQMVEKWRKLEFSTCPRFYCEKEGLLPIGLSDLPMESKVKLYCPRCCDLYEPKLRHTHIDGAYFGTGFPHKLFFVHPEYRPKPPTESFTARLHGFKIHPTAYELQNQAAEVAGASETADVMDTRALE